MNTAKALVFNYLSRVQKSSLCSFLKNFTKRYPGLSSQDILDEFIEEEACVQNLHFTLELLENSEFLKDVKMFIEAVLRDLKYKEAQRPYIEEQKKFAKEQRKRAQEYKMQHEKPTQKQLKYYKSLCKNKGIEPKPLEDASKLDLRNWIEELA